MKWAFVFRKCFLSSGGCQMLDWYIHRSISDPVLRKSQLSEVRHGCLLLHKAETMYRGLDMGESRVGLWASFREKNLGIRPSKMGGGERGNGGVGQRIQTYWAECPSNLTKGHWVKLDSFPQFNKYLPGMVGITHWNNDGFEPIPTLKWSGSHEAIAKA